MSKIDELEIALKLQQLRKESYGPAISSPYTAYGSRFSPYGPTLFQQLPPTQSLLPPIYHQQQMQQIQQIPTIQQQIQQPIQQQIQQQSLLPSIYHQQQIQQQIQQMPQLEQQIKQQQIQKQQIQILQQQIQQLQQKNQQSKPKDIIKLETMDKQSIIKLESKPKKTIQLQSLIERVNQLEQELSYQKQLNLKGKQFC